MMWWEGKICKKWCLARNLCETGWKCFLTYPATIYIYIYIYLHNIYIYIIIFHYIAVKHLAASFFLCQKLGLDYLDNVTTDAFWIVFLGSMAPNRAHIQVGFLATYAAPSQSSRGSVRHWATERRDVCLKEWLLSSNTPPAGTALQFSLKIFFEQFRARGLCFNIPPRKLTCGIVPFLWKRSFVFWWCQRPSSFVPFVRLSFHTLLYLDGGFKEIW